MLKTDFKFGDVYSLAAQLATNEQQVEFKEIMSNENGGIVLLSFSEGQQLSTHQAPAEVMVYCVGGEVEFTVLDRRLTVKDGDFFLMGNGVPHSVRALTDAKIMLIKIKPD